MITYKNFVILFITLVLLSVQVNSLSTTIKNNEYFLDSQSKCTTDCGTEASPFRTFNEAIAALSDRLGYPGSLNTPTLLVNQGEYYGELNKDININIDINIVSRLGPKETIIDCQGTGYGFRITGSSNVLIQGLAIKSCVAGIGGAINTNNLLTTLENVIFIENSAGEGSAIYSTSSMITISHCLFIKNKGDHTTNAVVVKDGYSRIESSKFFVNSNDIYCSKASIITSKDSVFGSVCDECQILDDDRNNYCGKSKVSKECNRDGKCDSPIETHANCPADCLSSTSICNRDNECDAPFENIDNCPSDCDVNQHYGWRLEYYDDALPKPSIHSVHPHDGLISYINLPHIVDFMGKKYAPVSGILKSDISVTTTGEYTFKLDVKNLGAIVLVNGRVLFDNYFYDNMPNIVHERSMLLSSRLPYTIEITFTAINDQQRDLAFYWKSESKPEYTLVPSYYITRTDTYTCGDGICNETPESCLIDCYDQIEKECPAQSPPSNLQPFYGPIKDTLGQLINNQYIFSLPGINFLSHGIDTLTGDALPAPIFTHTYCDNSSFSVVHAPHRGLVYSVPPGLHAQISPKCTMDTTTKSYENSYQLSGASTDDKSLSVSISGSYGGYFGKISASASFSMSESVQKASDMQKKTIGRIFHTELKCETSKVHVLEPHRFHPKFIRDIALSYHSTRDVAISRLKNVIKTYGVAYFKSATLGGKLEQISVVSLDYQFLTSSQQIEKSMDMSFSVSASSKVLPIRGSVSMSGSIDSKTSEQQQKSYETNSKRSTMIVSGGTPGSYGEDDFNSLHTWARTVDMTPFPIDYKAGYISEIIPDDWFLTKNFNVKQLWIDAVAELNREYYIKQVIEGKVKSNLSVQQLQSLRKQDTVYYFSNKDCVNTDRITLGYYIDDTLVNQPFTKEKTSEFLIGPFDDNIGIESINVEGGSTCTEFSVYNLFSSRIYSMAKVNGIFKNVLPVPNELTIAYWCTNVPSALILIEIKSTDQIMSFMASYDAQRKTFSVGDYFGEIKSMEVTNISEYPHLNINKFRVIQTCPAGNSDCIPKGAEYKPSQGYRKVYDSKDVETVAYPRNIKKVVSLFPFGTVEF